MNKHQFEKGDALCEIVDLVIYEQEMAAKAMRNSSQQYNYWFGRWTLTNDIMKLVHKMNILN